jgi:thiol:disulfide interchange protein DsbD
MKTTVSIVGLMIICSVAVSTNAVAQKNQKVEPIKWHYIAVRLNDEEARLIFTANLDAGWYIYSQFIEPKCAMPTTFVFIPDQKYSLKGSVTEESTPLRGCNNYFGIDLPRYMNSVVFTQDIRMVVPATVVRGKIAFMGCSNERCLPPDEIEFALEVNGK